MGYDAPAFTAGGVMTLAAVSLDDKYAAREGEVYMTGTQALVRLPMMQHLRDRAAGLDTACLISGYRGSPLGNFDRALWHARPFLERHGVLFQPGSQRGPGGHRPLGHPAGGPLPRREAGRGLRHLVRQGAGRRPHDGRLQARQQRRHRRPWRRARAGRRRSCLRLLHDRAPERVRLHERRHAGAQPGRRAGVPGLWAARLGALAPRRTLGRLHLHRRDGGQFGHRLGGPAPRRPSPCPRRRMGCREGGLNIRWPDTPLDQEERLLEHKLDAARAYGRANGLDRAVIDGPGRRLGIVTTGKSYLDVRQALDDLAIDDAAAQPPRPRALQGRHELAAGARRHRALRRRARRDRRRRGEAGLHREPDQGAALQSGRGRAAAHRRQVRRERPAAAPRLGRARPRRGRAGAGRAPRALRRGRAHRGDASPSCGRRWGESAAAEPAAIERVPYFCSGCPHNSSTVVPEGSRALAGIGCHYMAQWMDRETATFTHMGGEGASWIGQAPFTETSHVFQNIGDGTYFHSGILAIRAAVAARRHHDLQDPLQRRGGDDRRPAHGRPALGPARDPPDPGGRGGPHRRGHRPAREIPLRRAVRRRRDDPSPRRARPRAARAARPGRGCRPSSTTRCARPRSGAGASVACWRTPTSGSSSTRTCAKAAAIAACSRTASPWCRWRPSSAASGPSTSPPATRISPASRVFARASSWSRAGVGNRRRRGPATGRRWRCRSRRAPPAPNPTASCWRAWAAPGSSPSARCWARRRGWRARGPRCSTRRASPRNTAPSPAMSASPSGRTTSTPCASPRAAPGCCWAWTWWWRRAARRWRGSTAAARTPWSTAGGCRRATSPARPTSPSPPTSSKG